MEQRHEQPETEFYDTIDLHAFAPGDMSVGIHHQQWTIQNIGPLDDYDGQREDVRKGFAEAFAMLAGEGKVQIRFSDEPVID